MFIIDSIILENYHIYFNKNMFLNFLKQKIDNNL